MVARKVQSLSYYVIKIDRGVRIHRISATTYIGVKCAATASWSHGEGQAHCDIMCTDIIY